MTERLLEKARYHFDAELCESLAEAVELARANSRRGLLICGGEAIALEAADLLAESKRHPFLKYAQRACTLMKTCTGSFILV